MRRQRVERPERVKRPKISREARDLERIFNPPAGVHPLTQVNYTGNLEEDAASEAQAMADTFSGRAKLEAQRFELATDSEFWFAVCFKSREQKEAFLAAMGWAWDGDKYLNGCAIAEAASIKLPDVTLPKPKNISGRMKRLARNTIQGGDD